MSAFKDARYRPRPEPALPDRDYPLQNVIRETQVAYQFPRWMRFVEAFIATWLEIPSWCKRFMLGLVLIYLCGMIAAWWPGFVERLLQ